MLALAVYIFIVKRSASKDNSPCDSAWLKLSLSCFFVCVALSAAATIAILLAAAQGWAMSFFGASGANALAAHPWTVTTSYLAANALTALVFHRSTLWYFRNFSAPPPSQGYDRKRVTLEERRGQRDRCKNS